MENTPNTTTPTPNAASIKAQIAQVKPDVKTVSLGCNIRLRPGLVAIPNQSPEEFSYYLESILASSGGPLKGVTGVLERLIMPSIIDVSTNDNTFNSHIKEYWANFSNLLPPDTTNRRDTEQGIPVKIQVTLMGARAINGFAKLDRLDEKFAFVHDLLEQQELSDSTTKQVVLNSDYYADFLKLAFAIKHSRIANRVEDKEKSPKIFGYIYEKAIEVKAQESEMEVFNTFSDNIRGLTDEKKANAILLAIGEQVVDTDSMADKKIIIYNLAKTEHAIRVKVNKLIGDDNWMHKYYVQQGLLLHILKQPANSKLIQYGDKIVGNDLETAAHYLATDAEGMTIAHIIKEKLNDK